MENTPLMQKFILGLFQIAADRKLMREFDADVIEIKIKKLKGFKQAMECPNLLEVVREEFAQLSAKKNMFVVIAIVRDLHLASNDTKVVSNGEKGESEAETSENGADGDEADSGDDDSSDDDDDGGGQQLMNGVAKYSGVIGTSIGIPALVKKIKNMQPVKNTYTRAEGIYFKFLNRVFIIKKAILKVKTTWDDAALIALEKAMQKTADHLALRPFWYCIWFLLKALHYILVIIFLIARPWTILEKLGVDPDALPVGE